MRLLVRFKNESLQMFVLIQALQLGGYGSAMCD